MPRRRIALFTEVLDFDDSYSDLLWKAADSRARELDVDLVVCVGQRLETPQGFSPHTRLYHWSLEHAWDGIVVAHILYQHASPERLALFTRRLARYRHAVSSVALGAAPVVGFENEHGMAQLLDHVIGHHQKRRLVFVAGPLHVDEARKRYEVWQRAVCDAGLPSGPEWLVEADFNPLYCPWVVDAVCEKVAALGADAVVASSDLLAEALIRGLQAHGYAVPRDVLVTGFDDIPLASQMEPGLSTVRQPVWDQFRTLVDLALGSRTDVPAPAQGVLVVRGSCGCPDPNAHEDRDWWKARTYEARGQTRALRDRVAHLNLFASRIDTLAGPPELESLFAEWMPRLGIDGYALALSCRADGTLEPWVGSDPLAAQDGWLRWSGSRPGLAADETLVFPASQLAPEAWWSVPARRTLVALPLVVGDCWYGLTLLEVGPEGNLMCRAVQELTASFLDRDHRLKEEVRQAMEARISTQMEAEKNRTLGVLVAGMSHDLATPFSVGLDSIQLLVDGFAATSRALDDGTLSRSALAAFLARGQTVSDLLSSSWTRATELVERFKRIGTEVPRDDLRQVFLLPFLTDLLHSLKPLWRRRPITLELDIEPGLQVRTRVSALVDILTNLVQNALVHAFPPGRKGALLVKAQECGPLCRLVFQDDGVGVAPEVLDRIFEPYVTTKPDAGGTGLGLTVVRQRVQGLLEGTVVCERVAEGGTRFVLEFPRTLTE